MRDQRLGLCSREYSTKHLTHLISIALHKLAELNLVVLFKVVQKVRGVTRLGYLIHASATIDPFPVQYAAICICVKSKVFTHFYFLLADVRPH